MTHSIPSLFAHQVETAEFIIPKPHTFCTSTPGTGKTRSLLEVHDRTPGKTLVVCPKTIMDAAWATDIKRFYPHVKYEVFNRKYQSQPYYYNRLFDENEIVIINHDAVKDVLDRVKSLPELHNYSRLVYDEFTAIKNRTAIRSKASNKLAQYFENKTLLSGSPTPKNLLDIWYPSYVLDGGQRLGTSFYHFRNAICQPVAKRYGQAYTEWEVLPGAEEEVAYLLRDITIRHELEEVLDMPERIYRPMTLPMPDALRKQYQVMKQQALLELEGGDVSAVNAAVLSNKLLQICSGSVYDSTGEAIKLHLDKYELIRDLVAERDHSLVFIGWNHQVDALSDLYKKAGITFEVINGSVPQAKRGQIVEDFQQGKYQTLILHPAAAAHGLTLTRSTTTIWASPTWNLEHFIQSNHRDYRAGQNKRSEVIMLEYADTIERRVYDNLQKKTDVQTRLLEILKT
jgi:SNF2 family DNA or RNA helicase